VDRAYTTPHRLFCAFDVLQKADLVLREIMGPRAVAQERDVAERWPAIDLLAVGDVGHHRKPVAVDVLSIQPQRSIPTLWDTLCGVQTDEVAPCKPVENAPHLSLRVREKVGRFGLAPGAHQD
jgi:hypothetical protein